MRIIHEFKFKNKFFRAGELTVGDYMLSVEDFDFFVQKILSEFNPKIPKLEPEYLEAFLDIIFWKKENLRVFREKNTSNPKDMHIVVGVFMRNMHQGYLDVIAMPMRIFNLMLDDMECIVDPSKYDPNRNDTSPDRESIRKTFGINNGEIKG